MTLTAPVVFRLRYVAGPRAGRRGGCHARYIATREGVARGEASSDPLIHARYLGERPGSTGLFGPEPDSPPDLAAVQGVLRDRTWHWQMVLSLREEDALALGLETSADWRDLTRRVLPQYASALGVPAGDLGWAAAMHHKAGHPHVHVLAWLRAGAAERSPGLSRAELRAVRRIVARETYGPVRAQAVAAKTAERDYLLAAGRLNLRALRRAVLEAQIERPVRDRLPPRFTRTELGDLERRVTSLRARLPAHGQIRLGYMPPAVRAEARSVADWILDRAALAPSLAAMEAAARELTGLYRTDPAAGDAAWRRAREDVRDRIAQGVLRAAVGTPAARSPSASERLLRSAHRLLQAERLRAEAGTELARLTDEQRAESRSARTRAAEMGAHP